MVQTGGLFVCLASNEEEKGTLAVGGGALSSLVCDPEGSLRSGWQMGGGNNPTALFARAGMMGEKKGLVYIKRD